jgi:hypothetical protein
VRTVHEAPAARDVTGATCDDGGVTKPAEPTPAPRPGPPAPRGRHNHGLRDMVLSMVVLGVVILVLGLITHSCSFDPGKPDTSGVVTQPVDVHAELQAAATQVHFPLREPHLPAGWHPNSDSVNPLGPDSQYAEVRVGWLTPDNHYAELTQSNADVTDLVRSVTGDADGPVTATGGTTVDGVRWTSYPGVRQEITWIADQGGARLLITGDASPAQFSAMANAVLHGTAVTPLPS